MQEKIGNHSKHFFPCSRQYEIQGGKNEQTFFAYNDHFPNVSYYSLFDGRTDPYRHTIADEYTCPADRD